MENTGFESGGGGSGGICTISSSDLVGLVDNLLTRMENLERILNLLTGMNITTSSIDQISANLGTMTNATLINAARGWITEGTFSGVALSTLGWTMSDGSVFPFVVMQDGVLVYGWDIDGNIAGTMGGTVGNGAMAMVYTDSCIPSFTSALVTDFGVMNYGYDPTGLVAAYDATGFTVTKSGWYTLSLSTAHSNSGALGTIPNHSIRWDLASNQTSDTNVAIPDGTAWSGPKINFPTWEGSNHAHCSSKMVHMTAGQINTLSIYSDGEGVGSVAIGAAFMYLHLLREGVL